MQSTHYNLSFINSILKGFGQIFLQENPYSGILFLIGIAVGSPILTISTILATVCGTLSAELLKYNKHEIESGLYGFNTALIGVALMLFLKPIFMTWILIIISSIIATFIQYYLLSKKLPLFTFTFVIITWLIIFFVNHFYIELLNQKEFISQSATTFNFTSLIKGFGQVIFQDNLISSCLFILGILINSPLAVIYGGVGAILSGFLAYLFKMPLESINNGLFSYNAVLCAIVFANTELKNMFWALCSILLSLFLVLVMTHFQLMQLTFPFVLSSFIMVSIKKRLVTKQH